MASTITQTKTYNQVRASILEYFRVTPHRFMAILVGCILLAILAFGVVFTTFSGIHGSVQTVGRDTHSSIIAAEQIQACLASADANGLNATLLQVQALPNSKQWDRYRSDMNCAHDQLITASQNVSSGNTDRNEIFKIESALGDYEYQMGQAGESAAGPIASDQRFQTDILPASSRLDSSTYERLNQLYRDHRSSVGWQMPLVWFCFLLLIGALGASQWYLFRRTRRVINVGFAVASVMTILVLIYSVIVLNAGEAQLQAAKQKSLDNINALWSARAMAYDMNALESLYMIDNKNLTKDEQTFSNFAHLIVNIDPLTAVTNAEYHNPFGGYLGNELSHISYPGERDAAVKAVDAWAAYINIDKQMRDLMQAGAPAQATYFNTRFLQDQSSLAFNQFDQAISRVIAIDQSHFDDQINSALGILQLFPFILIGWLVGLIVACVYGMKPRLDEYAV